MNILGCQFLDNVLINLTSQKVGLILRHLPIRHTHQLFMGFMQWDVGMSCIALRTTWNILYVGGTESILTAQTGLMLIVIANVLGFQSQCKSVRLTIQYHYFV